MRNKGRKSIVFFALLLIVFFGGMFLIRGEKRELGYDQEVLRSVWVDDDGLLVRHTFSGKKTVGEFLKEKQLLRERTDDISVPMDQKLFGGETVAIARTKKILLSVGEEKAREIETTRGFALDAVIDQGVELAADDFILPSAETLLEDNLEVSVVRVVVTETTEEEVVAFATKVTEDGKMGWREKKVTQKGENGMREKRYKVVSHNGEMVKKILISNEITKDPVTEEVIQGTYVKLGKKNTGQGTWYAYTGTLAAASPWLPMGSYAKVTNVGNGKSVIVKINDRGPFGKNRIIDLDKVAFTKIASIGAGVIDVVVEPVLN